MNSLESTNNQPQGVPGEVKESHDNVNHNHHHGKVVPLQNFLSHEAHQALKLYVGGEEALLRQVIKLAPVFFYCLDSQGIFTLAEGKAWDTLELQSNKLIGQSIFEIFEHIPNFLTNIHAGLGGKEVFWESTIANMVYDNHVIPLIQENNEIVGLVGISVLNITKYQQTEEQLRLLAAAVNSAEDAIMITSTDLESPGPTILFVNPAFTKMTGYTAQEAIGRNPRFLQGPNTDRTVLNKLRQSLETGEVFYGQAINYRKDGTEFYNEWHIEPIRDNQGRITHYLGVQRDITERKKAEEQLINNALYDSLTGLPNRTLWIKGLEEAIAKAQKCQDYLFAVLFLDLDRFKLVNDSLGHLAGDELLIAIAKRLQSTLRPTDTVARLGGDEFGILLTNIRELENISNVVNRIQASVRQPLKVEGQEVFTTASIGIALSTAGYDSSQDLMRDADIAMYRAKALGKARYCLFNKTMHQIAVSRLRLETDLRRALERQELRLHYQPLVSLKTGEITGFEALVRWEHPEQGLISPDQFIPVAEETGLINPIGWWVLREACLKLRIWQLTFPRKIPLTMSVNLSGKQFAQPGLIEQVDLILRETGCDRNSLKLELTESAIMDHSDANSILENLRALGVKLDIDDFGIGYSSLDRLYQFPINTLKIDKSFVSRLDAGGRNVEIVKAIVTLAHTLGMNVVGEGVESSYQLTQLQALNCEFAQGYFFSRPLDSKATEALLTSQPKWFCQVKTEEKSQLIQSHNHITLVGKISNSQQVQAIQAAS
ncbi:EAL domain-containing protein [Aerosakkonemataceae cyanobacterium BLCC-F154]|uniref:EAL domain-containing protein n=1 Tax=Floridaenema fluviatile BLCC-F154 TaxID=3153640 RepID=A0ABV4Y956_9CYAN